MGSFEKPKLPDRLTDEVLIDGFTLEGGNYYTDALQPLSDATERYDDVQLRAANDGSMQLFAAEDAFDTHQDRVAQDVDRRLGEIYSTQDSSALEEPAQD